MRVRVVGKLIDYADFQGALARTNWRQFESDPQLVREYMRRFSRNQICAANPRNHEQVGCHCMTGVQYKTDEDIQEFYEGCAPDDVWSCATSLLRFHEKMGRGANEALLGDCDDLAPLSAALVKHMHPQARVWVALAMPDNSNIAHAFHLQNFAPTGHKLQIVGFSSKGERLPPLWLYDSSVRAGMQRPPDTFYTTGKHALVELLAKDL